MVSKGCTALAVLAAGAAIPYTLDSAATWKIVLLWSAVAVFLIAALASSRSVTERIWDAVARRVAPRLDAQSGLVESRARARHVVTELGTIDKTVEGAVSSGGIWNVRFEGLPSAEWTASADVLARHASAVHDLVAPVYVEADQLNKLAKNYTQGGIDELDDQTLDRMKRFRNDVADAVEVLRRHAS